jgi:hypothetical protein
MADGAHSIWREWNFFKALDVAVDCVGGWAAVGGGGADDIDQFAKHAGDKQAGVETDDDGCAG